MAFRCVSPPVLTALEFELTSALLSIPFEWLQDNHSMREECKEMVQGIFDTLKGNAVGNPQQSSLAGAALKKIIASTALYHPHKRDFMSALSGAVKGVGDNNWKLRIGN